MRTLCRDFSHIVPTIVRINRGKLSLEGIAEKAVEHSIDKVIIIERWKNGPGKIQPFDVKQDGLESVPPIIYMRNVKLRRDFGEQMPKGRRIKSVAIATSSKENFEVKKLENVLSNFFGVPVLSLEEAGDGKCDAVIQVLMDSLNHIIITFKLIPELVEVGPQVNVSHLVWELNR